MNERIALLRKSLKLNQTEFGKGFGAKQTTIAGYENGSRAPSDIVINSICSVYNANEDWLRTGEGTMFIEVPEEDEVMKYVGSLLRNEDDIVAKAVIGFITEYQKLNPVNKGVIKDFLKNALDHIKE